MSSKVVLLGSMGIAAECLRWLRTRSDVDLVGVVCSRKGPSAWRRAVGDEDVQQVAREHGVPLLDLEDVVGLGADLGLSVRFHQILRRRHLDAFRLGIVNLHGAPLPEMRGSMCDAAAILEGHSSFGTSLHWMDEGIDTGDLVAVARFPIATDDTVYDLFGRANRLGLELIQENLSGILQGTVARQVQDELVRASGETPRTYTEAQVMALKAAPASCTPEELWDRARAFAFPGHDPAYIETPCGRVHITLGTPRSLQKKSSSGVKTSKVSNRSTVSV